MENGILDEKWSYESVLSHAGLRRVYNFFREADHNARPSGTITTQDIVRLAGESGDQAAQDAIQFFCEVLANFCGNAALTFNCDKAVFLWGGALQNIPRDTLHSRFKRHYHQRCKHGDRVGNVPVVLLTNKDIPLLGCAHYSAFAVELRKEMD
jgi:glucokinase